MSCWTCLKTIGEQNRIVLKTAEVDREFCSVSHLATFVVTAARQLEKETATVNRKETVSIAS